jgi:hypothetical protein
MELIKAFMGPTKKSHSAFGSRLGKPAAAPLSARNSAALLTLEHGAHECDVDQKSEREREKEKHCVIEQPRGP